MASSLLEAFRKAGLADEETAAEIERQQAVEKRLLSYVRPCGCQSVPCEHDIAPSTSEK